MSWRRHAARDSRRSRSRYADTVAHELGGEWEHLASVRVHDGGLQDVMMIARDAGCGGVQAVPAVDQFGTEVA